MQRVRKVSLRRTGCSRFFPGVFSEHEETFKRQNGSEATFCDSSLLGIANPNEFRTETAQRLQKQEFGITEKVINEDYTLFTQQNGSEEALVESSLSGIANSNQFSSETARSSQGKEFEITEIVINGESMPKKAPLPRIEESRDLGSRPIANSQSQTMAETETELRRQTSVTVTLMTVQNPCRKGHSPALHACISRCHNAVQLFSHRKTPMFRRRILSQRLKMRF